ncbi:MAG: hypothetical protein PHQ59_05050 [Candidatus Daviesbacteria bacterium]|nr:hypothetical protein [Candidatus Daviesbacteria bacterium]
MSVDQFQSHLRVKIGEPFSPFCVPMETDIHGSKTSSIVLDAEDFLPELGSPVLNMILFNRPAYGSIMFNPYNRNIRRVKPFSLGDRFKTTANHLILDFQWDKDLPAEYFVKGFSGSHPYEPRFVIKDALMRLKLNLFFPSAIYKEFEAGFINNDIDFSQWPRFDDLRYKGEAESFVNSRINAGEKFKLTIPNNKLKEVKAAFMVGSSIDQIKVPDSIRLAFPDLF